MKLWTTLHDDPGMKRLSDRAFRYYINAWSFCGLHETDGRYEVFGKHPKMVAELVAAGKFIPTDDPDTFQIHGWGKRQRTVAELDARRNAAKEAADARWSKKRKAKGNASRIAERNADETRRDESRGEQASEPSSDLAVRSDRFDEFWAVYPRKQGKGAAREKFKRACRKADPERIIAGAVRYRDDPNREEQFTTLPETWLNQERWDDGPVPPRGSQRGSNTSRLLALADRMEAQ